MVTHKIIISPIRKNKTLTLPLRWRRIFIENSTSQPFFVFVKLSYFSVDLFLLPRLRFPPILLGYLWMAPLRMTILHAYTLLILGSYHSSHHLFDVTYFLLLKPPNAVLGFHHCRFYFPAFASRIY